MRRKYEPITVSFITQNRFFGWTRCDVCGDEVCKEPMFIATHNNLHPMSPKNVTETYCKMCAPSKEAALSLFDRRIVNPIRPKAPPPPPKPRSITGESK
ncbi:MAG: hypothetical protein JRJ45_00360 [Deltaproteobacteria bacterium]|nr:hypothetical protein [Deltaproteobacteria bacterium]